MEYQNQIELYYDANNILLIVDDIQWCIGFGKII